MKPPVSQNLVAHFYYNIIQIVDKTAFRLESCQDTINIFTRVALRAVQRAWGP